VLSDELPQGRHCPVFHVALQCVVEQSKTVSSVSGRRSWMLRLDPYEVHLLMAFTPWGMKRPLLDAEARFRSGGASLLACSR
jgi:hypothetical protein